jgi:tRNA threonylcarbamoyladenosine biosynthesis protein TsaB
MLLLTIRTDNPEAELGLFDDQTKLAYVSWQAHKQLSETIHLKIKELLDQENLSLNDLNGIAVFKGPGSFTGLRIGISVANALAYALNIPVVSSKGDDWTLVGIKRLLNKENEEIALPEYGREPHITKQTH